MMYIFPAYSTWGGYLACLLYMNFDESTKLAHR